MEMDRKGGGGITFVLVPQSLQGTLSGCLHFRRWGSCPLPVLFWIQVAACPRGLLALLQGEDQVGMKGSPECLVFPALGLSGS